MRIAFGMLTAAALLMQTGVGFADQMYTPEEFSKVTDAAVAQFKIDMPTMVATFYGLTMTRDIANGTETGVIVKVYTQATPADPPVVMSKYHCHKHDTGLTACHPE